MASSGAMVARITKGTHMNTQEMPEWERLLLSEWDLVPRVLFFAFIVWMFSR